MDVEPMRVEPFYGWGWSGPFGGVGSDVPDPFEVAVERVADGRVYGVVSSSGHALDGQPFIAASRHATFYGVANVRLDTPLGVVLGFADVPGASPLGDALPRPYSNRSTGGGRLGGNRVEAGSFLSDLDDGICGHRVRHGLEARPELVTA